MARARRATKATMGYLGGSLAFCVLLGLAACGSDGSSGGASGGTSGSSAGGSSAGGSSSGGAAGGGGLAGASSGGDSGGGGSAGSSSGGSAGGGASGGSGGASGGAGGTGSCAPTPSAVKCGAASCDTKTQECCGGPVDGKCFGLTAFCGLGGGIRMECDDPSDCADGEVCCVAEVPNAGNDAPYQTHCVKPKTFQEGGDVFGCGTTGGGFPWPRLCTCAADCNVGSCKYGTIPVPTTSASYLRCE